jgi:hypothetical protein
VHPHCTHKANLLIKLLCSRLKITINAVSIECTIYKIHIVFFVLAYLLFIRLSHFVALAKHTCAVEAFATHTYAFEECVAKHTGAILTIGVGIAANGAIYTCAEPGVAPAKHTNACLAVPKHAIAAVAVAMHTRPLLLVPYTPTLLTSGSNTASPVDPLTPLPLGLWPNTP